MLVLLVNWHSSEKHKSFFKIFSQVSHYSKVRFCSILSTLFTNSLKRYWKTHDAKDVSFYLLHHTILLTDSKVRAALQYTCLHNIDSESERVKTYTLVSFRELSFLNFFLFYYILSTDRNFYLLYSETNNIKIFVLDEADEMLSRGFKDQIYDVFRKLSSNVQVCLRFLSWLKIATDIVANVTKIPPWLLKILVQWPLLMTRFLYDLDTNTLKQTLKLSL